jgi:hypothetical protein
MAMHRQTSKRRKTRPSKLISHLCPPDPIGITGTNGIKHSILSKIADSKEGKSGKSSQRFRRTEMGHLNARKQKEWKILRFN